MPRNFLFLQGPISPFFAEVAAGLKRLGYGVYQIQFSFADRLFWPHPGAVRFRDRFECWPDFVRAFMRRHGITDLILLGEQRDYHKVAIEVAHRLGIAVTVTDFGYLRPDWITWERDGMSANSHFPRDPDQICALAARCPELPTGRCFQDSFWTMARWDMLYHLSNYFLSWLFPHYRNHQAENPVLVYLGTGWRLLWSGPRGRQARSLWQTLSAAGVPRFLYPLQMAKDYSIRAYSHYARQEDAMREVIASFASHAPAQAHLLVKVHPWDPGLTSWRRVTARLAREHGVRGRVHYLDGGDLLAMSAIANGLVTINSTAGLAALQVGCPVKVLGQALYDIPGMTHKGSLEEFWQRPQPPDAKLLADFLRALAATVQIRGVFYARPGLDAAVHEAVLRLHLQCVNDVLPQAGHPTDRTEDAAERARVGWATEMSSGT